MCYNKLKRDNPHNMAQLEMIKHDCVKCALKGRREWLFLLERGYFVASLSVATYSICTKDKMYFMSRCAFRILFMHNLIYCTKEAFQWENITWNIKFYAEFFFLISRLRLHLRLPGN